MTRLFSTASIKQICLFLFFLVCAGAVPQASMSQGRPKQFCIMGEPYSEMPTTPPWSCRIVHKDYDFGPIKSIYNEGTRDTYGPPEWKPYGNSCLRSRNIRICIAP